MWVYEQSTGQLRDKTMHPVYKGYAGHGEGLNNPKMANVQNVGPLPCGMYTMEKPVDTKTHGPYVIWLTPHKDNQMFDRAGFGIHGDEVKHPNEQLASHGCPIFPRIMREMMWESGDHDFAVIP